MCLKIVNTFPDHRFMQANRNCRLRFLFRFCSVLPFCWHTVDYIPSIRVYTSLAFWTSFVIFSHLFLVFSDSSIKYASCVKNFSYKFLPKILHYYIWPHNLVRLFICALCISTFFVSHFFHLSPMLLSYFVSAKLWAGVTIVSCIFLQTILCKSGPM